MICASLANEPLLDARTLLDGLIGALAGGVMGLVATLATLRAEGRSRRTEVAVNILERYMNEFEKIGEAKGLLAQPLLLLDLHNVHLLNDVIRIGDWYDIVSGLCLHKVADSTLLETIGFKEEMKRFADNVNSANVGPLATAAKHWNQLQKYVGVTLVSEPVGVTAARGHAKQ